MSRHSQPSLLKRARKFRLNALLKLVTDTNPQTQKTRRVHKLWNWAWIIVIVAVVIVGGRFLFFRIEGSPFQLPMKARNWTGFGESYDNNVSEVAEKGTETDGKITKKIDKVTTTQKKLEPAKTLWDWMGLLLAPATLAGLGFLFQFSQERAKRDKEEADKKRDADQQREQALQTYFDQLSELLVDKQLLRKLSEEKKEGTNTEAEGFPDGLASKIAFEGTKIDANAALDVVKAKTLALFRLFDNADPTDMPRKASMLAFLGDAGLLKALGLDLSGTYWAKSNLRRANLSGVNLSGTNLSGANLRLADLSGANLSGADLSGADLSGANLSGAVLSDANLRLAIFNGGNLNGANIFRADLNGAILNGAILNDANLRRADLSGADLSGAILNGAILRRANLSGANLGDASLKGANLSDVNFNDANLSDTDLSHANLSDANLKGANLSDANFSRSILLRVNFTETNLTQQQLQGKKPPLLCNAIFPEGIKVNDPKRDCEKVSEVLLRRYPEIFRDLAAVQKYVDEHSNY